MLWVAVIVLLLTYFAKNHAWQTSVPRKGKSNYMSHCDCPNVICTNVTDYPEHAINQAMERQESLTFLSEGQIFNASVASIVPTVRNRDGTATASPLCITMGPTIYQAKAMRNKKNECKLIVNTNKYKQTFTVELCREQPASTNKKTGDDCKAIFDMECKQTYEILSLLTYDTRHDLIQFDRFQIPSTCKCCG